MQFSSWKSPIPFEYCTMAPGAGHAFRHPGSAQCMHPSLRISHSRSPLGFSYSAKRITVQDASVRSVMRFAEYENPKGDLEWLIRKDGCMHCADPGCLKACPAPGAIVQYSNGIVDFHEENCIGCGYCITGCPFDIPRISKRDHKAYKCTLCSDRVAVGLEPACIKACPTGALVFGTKEDMQQHAAERVEDLKSRGFERAGLYDPPGVGGTHVMYVLHHADQPQLYAGLAADPHISSLVGLWKGASKPIALAAMAFTALAGFFHFVRVGRKEIDERDEAAARQALEGAPPRNAPPAPGAPPILNSPHNPNPDKRP